MRVLHIDTGRQMRGGQWQVVYLLEALSRAQAPCLLLVRPGTPLWREAKARRLGVRPLTWRSLRSESSAAELVHAHDAGAHTLAALFSRAPLVVSRRVAFPVRRGRLSVWKYGRAAHYVAVSEHVRQVLLGAGVPPQKVTVVYDGVPAGASSRHEGNFIAPATDDPAKGSGMVREAARLSGIEVRFSENLLEDIEAASCLIYITSSEGLGSGALAAMAAGVPVIASRVGGLPEIVVDGINGLLTSNDPASIAAAMRRLRDDSDLRRRLGEAGRKMVQDRFSVDAMARGTLGVYRQVLTC